jgi:hypothetical protein
MSKNTIILLIYHRHELLDPIFTQLHEPEKKKQILSVRYD